MTPPVSTSCRRLRLKKSCGIAVLDRVVGRVGVPAAVDDPDPGAGEHAHGVRVIVPAGDGVGVDL